MLISKCEIQYLIEHHAPGEECDLKEVDHQDSNAAVYAKRLQGGQDLKTDMNHKVVHSTVLFSSVLSGFVHTDRGCADGEGDEVRD